MSGMTQTAGGRPRGLLAKREAILEAARSTFAAHGYQRASIDAIAALAAVSTRTIYNHFGGKAELFSVIVRDSAARVAEALAGLVDHHLGAVGDVEAAFTGLARAWVSAKAENASHFAMVRQMREEEVHLPPGLVGAWQEVGPVRVHRALARGIGELGRRGLLHIDDPDRAAEHFLLLTTGTAATRGLLTGTSTGGDDEVDAAVRAGVRTFLYGHSASGSR
ncbi:TetR family transcriptional regulator [Saccharopolyspora erythraea NRRL 2338]|nr:TetR family transcriptional regulator [Saccharopolyspora erythraea NRRL 2338]